MRQGGREREGMEGGRVGGTGKDGWRWQGGMDGCREVGREGGRALERSRLTRYNLR